MRVKLFSKQSLLVGLKALGTNLVSQLASIPLWALTMFFINKGMFAVGVVMWLLSMITSSLLFFGFFASNWWKWK